MTGSRTRGRPKPLKVNWMNNVMDWINNRAADDREVWRQIIVCDTTNPRYIEDG